MQKTGKLELTWVGKYDEVAVEPRILIEDPSKSYGDPNSENMLIHGDNLIALQALQQDYAGTIKCIYIDPPFNTGARINADGDEIGYEDGLEHSEWLSMMFARLKLLHSLLNETGVLVVHLDDRELFHCKLMLDEIFHRDNYLNTITMTTNEPSGFKATGVKIFSTANFMLVYAKDKSKVNVNKLYIKKDYDDAYNKIFTEKGEDYKSWKWISLKDFVAKEEGYESYKAGVKARGALELDAKIKEAAIKYADRVFRTAALGGGAKLKRKDTIALSQRCRNEIFVHPGEDMPDFYILNGEQIVFYKNRLEMIDGELTPAQVITDVWNDISWTGIAGEGNVVFKNSKKPELLIRRVLEMFTSEGDFVLDSFLGSGTTMAVAHKMKRQWIGIEMAPHCYSHCKARIDSVINGEQSGISKLLGWQGGGGYKFYELAPSLLVKNPVLPVYQINPEYTFDMLCEAICKIEGFRYKVDGVYHGYSSEKRFIHITKEFINAEYIKTIAATLGEDQSLLIYGTKIQSGLRLPDNIEVKKIPKDLLDKCTFESEVR